jgi:hypothetical protein
MVFIQILDRMHMSRVTRACYEDYDKFVKHERYSQPVCSLVARRYATPTPCQSIIDDHHYSHITSLYAR